MKCPKCKEVNPKKAYYCHNCGKKLRTKVNGWLICSIILFLATILLGLLAFDYADSMVYYKMNYNDLYYEKQSVSDQLIKKKSEISELNSEISRLRDQIPQSYYTKYSNQYLYYWKGYFEKTDYYYNESGALVTIYTQKDGYGLSDWGWIPMNRLEKN